MLGRICPICVGQLIRKRFPDGNSYIFILVQNDSEIFHMNDILQLLREHPEIGKMNSDVARSEMYKSV